MIEAAIDFLLAAQNKDGGWGATRGKRSNTEVTSFVLLGLQALKNPLCGQGITRGLAWLTAQQRTDGSWPPLAELQEGSWVTALAVLALGCFGTSRQRAVNGADWLLRQKGREFGWLTSLRYRWAPHTLDNQFNPNLQGWSWTPNTFSLVEPTAYALIALKKLRYSLPKTQAKERIHQGELLLYDRMCNGGGWNYGNSTVLGKDLAPYPDTTAVALIALQDRQTTEANQQSLRALHNMLAQVETGLTLSWSILCFALYGRDVSAWCSLLAKRYEQTGFLSETKSIALALLALSEEGVNLFRV
jgi:squalene cyclase